MGIKQWTLLLSSIAPFISTVVIFFTLIEMRNQRRSAYKPDIVLEETNFNISWDEEDKEPHLWLSGSEEDLASESESYEKNISGQFAMNIFNLGMGAGKYLDWPLLKVVQDS